MIEKSAEIKDLKVSFVSLVDRAANKREFLLTKAKESGASWVSSGTIIKADEDTHYVTGIVYEPDTPDTDDEYMSAEEIKKAAYWFSKHAYQMDIQHCFVPAEGVSVVESYIAPCDMTIGETKVKAGTWILTAEIKNDDIWNAIKKGEITGLSMGGIGISEDNKSKAESKEKSFDAEMIEEDILGQSLDITLQHYRERIFDIARNLKKFQLSDEQIAFSVQEASVDIVDILINTLKSGNKGGDNNIPSKETKKEKKDDNSDSTEDKEISEEENEEGDDEMTKDEFKELLNEAVNAIVSALKPVESSKDDKEEPKKEEPKKEPEDEKEVEEEKKTEKSESAVDVEKAISDAIDKVLASKGIVSAVNETAVNKSAENEEHYLHGIL